MKDEFFGYTFQNQLARWHKYFEIVGKDKTRFSGKTKDYDAIYFVNRIKKEGLEVIKNLVLIKTKIGIVPCMKPIEFGFNDKAEIFVLPEQNPGEFDWSLPASPFLDEEDECLVSPFLDEEDEQEFHWNLGDRRFSNTKKPKHMLMKKEYQSPLGIYDDNQTKQRMVFIQKLEQHPWEEAANLDELVVEENLMNDRYFEKAKDSDHVGFEMFDHEGKNPEMFYNLFMYD
jgi:hypothetical protein